MMWLLICFQSLYSEASVVNIETSKSALESAENATTSQFGDYLSPLAISTAVLSASEGQRKLQEYVCDKNCTNNGFCKYGVCDCSDLYYGSFCEEYPEYLKWDTRKDIKIDDGSWKYYLIDFGELELEADVTKNPITCHLKPLNTNYPTLPDRRHSASIIRFGAKNQTQNASVQGNYAEETILVVGFYCERKYEACEVSFIFNDLTKEEDNAYMVWLVLGVVVTAVRGM